MFPKVPACIVLMSTFVLADAAAQLPTGIGWHPIPNTRLRSVCAAENGYSQVSGSTGCPAITSAWSGGVFDSLRNRLIIWGGGHNDYYGNELYAVSLNSLTVERITNPGLPIASSCSESIANGTQPNSRHTYDGIEYIASADKMFVFGGSLACGAGNFSNGTWTFDFSTSQWQRMNPSGQLPSGDAGMLTAYDPNSGLVFLHDRIHLYSYDVTTDRYTRLSNSSAGLGYHLAATIDPSRRKFVIVGYDSTKGGGRVYTYDIGPGSSYQLQTVSTSGGSSIIGQAYPGLDYDPANSAIVAWAGNNRNNVYSLDLDTRQWTVVTYSGGPTEVANGTHGRWRYSNAAGVFVLANRVDDNVYILRTGTVIRPGPPEDLSAQ